MKNIHLNQLYTCDRKHYRKKINCKHWSIDQNICKPICSLKKINPTLKDCFECEKIEFVENPSDLKNHQTNIYKPNINSENIKSYVKAEASQMIQGKVTEEIFEKRKNHCMGCERRKNPHLETEPIGWCTSCTCGITPRAALSKKLYIPTISCPLNKFGPEKGDGFNTKDVVDSVAGIASSVKSLFEKDK